MDPQTRYAHAGDISIAYQVLGDGPRNLVVAPGFISHVELDWEQPKVRHFTRGGGRMSGLPASTLLLESGRPGWEHQVSDSPREAGWYPDRNDPEYHRYWNGRAWTARRQPVDQQPMHELKGRHGWRSGRRPGSQQVDEPKRSPRQPAPPAVIRQPVSVPSQPVTGSARGLVPDASGPVPKPAKAKMPVWLWIIGGLMLLRSLAGVVAAFDGAGTQSAIPPGSHSAANSSVTPPASPVH